MTIGSECTISDALNTIVEYSDMDEIFPEEMEIEDFQERAIAIIQAVDVVKQNVDILGHTLDPETDTDMARRLNILTAQVVAVSLGIDPKEIDIPTVRDPEDRGPYDIVEDNKS